MCSRGPGEAAGAEQDAPWAGGCRSSSVLGRVHRATQGSCAGLNGEKGFANSGVTRAKHMN